MRNPRWGIFGAVIVALALAGCSKEEPRQVTRRRPNASTSQASKKASSIKATASVSTSPVELSTTTDTKGRSAPTVKSSTINANRGAVSFRPTVVKSHTNIMMVFDASGSMQAPIETDTKLSYVKSMIKDLLVQPAPRNMKRSFGLQTFGSQYPVSEQQCEDSAVLAELGKMEPGKLGPAIDAIQARGTSPIAHALTKTALQFPPANDDTDNMIILVADGGDTCQQDPCLVAKNLHNGPSKIIVHVIGFDLDQKAEAQLRCVAKATDGRFFLARNIPELRSFADQAVNINLPYNLRVKALAGTSPIPTQMTVYRSGTQQVMDQGSSSGTKFFQLPPGTYDILISYEDSVESQKPSKTLKRVEIQGSARAEQVIQFDLGRLELSGIAPSGNPIGLKYMIRRAEGSQIIATVEGGSEASSVMLSPGSYIVSAQGPTINDIPLTATTDQLRVRSGDRTQHTFRFEQGEVFLRARTSNGTFTAAKYRIAAEHDPKNVLTSGTVPTEGTALTLPVGRYIVQMQPTTKQIQGKKAHRLTGVEVAARDRVQELVTFPVGTMTLIGKEGDGMAAKTEFTIRMSGEESSLIQEVTRDTAANLTLAPGMYHVTAVRLGGKVTPPPTIIWEDIEVIEDKIVAKESIFHLGSLQLASRGGNEQALASEFAIYRPGGKSPIAIQRTSGDPITFKLTPGLYDIRARDESSATEVKPTIWLHEVPIMVNDTTAKNVVFTSGRVRITCRGTNNILLPCAFRIFTYGQDAPLFSDALDGKVEGRVDDAWRTFEMKPGYYYVEVGYEHPEDDHILKKWLNLSVAENQTVEKVVRF